MKQTRFVLLALVGALVLMGAVYAAWTQSFNITGTVSTGELFVKVEEAGNTVEVKEDGTYVVLDQHEGIFSFDTSDSEDTSSTGETTLASISYTLSNIYPGTKLTSTIKFTNLGTIVAKTSVSDKNLNSDQDSNFDLWNDLVLKVAVDSDDEEDAEIIGGFGSAKLDNLAEKIAELIGTLEVGEANSKTITIFQEFPDTSQNVTENKSVTWSVDLEFTQNN